MKICQKYNSSTKVYGIQLYSPIIVSIICVKVGKKNLEPKNRNRSDKNWKVRFDLNVIQFKFGYIF